MLKLVPIVVDLALPLMTYVKAKFYGGPLDVCKSEMLVNWSLVAIFDRTSDFLSLLQAREPHASEGRIQIQLSE